MSMNVLATLNTGGGTDLLKIKASMDKAIAERETAKVELGAAEKALAAAVAAKNKAIEKSTMEKVDLIKEKMRNASKPTVIGQRIWEFLKGTIANIFAALGKLWRPACDYIVFFGVIFLLLYGFSSIFSHNSSIKSFGHIQLGNMNPFQLSLYKIKLWFINLFKWFRPGYSVKSALSMFDTNNSMASSIPREVVAGRCENMTNVEDSNECVANHPPDDYKFTIKPESMPDWHLLPDHFKATDQLTLYMPYSSSASGDNSFYIPKCDQTYYKTAAGVKVPVRMYTDNGLTCSFLQINSSEYKNNKRIGS
jgi:hypothetical protein